MRALKTWCVSLQPPKVENGSIYLARQTGLTALACGNLVALTSNFFQFPFPILRIFFSVLLLGNIAILVFYKLQPVFLIVTSAGLWIRVIFRPYIFVPLTQVGSIESVVTKFSYLTGGSIPHVSVWRSLPEMRIRYRGPGWEFKGNDSESELTVSKLSIKRPLADLYSDLKVPEKDFVPQDKYAAGAFQLKIVVVNLVLFLVEGFFILNGFASMTHFYNRNWPMFFLTAPNIWLAISTPIFYRRLTDEKIW